MKWYMGVNEYGLSHYERVIKTAVMSNLHTNNFEANLVYAGSPNEITGWLQKHGVTIHNREVSFVRNFRETATRRNHFNPDVAAGAYLRTEIPLHERDEYVLYTDVDVVFLKSIDLTPFKPRYFACSDELCIKDNKCVFVPTVFNSGIMLMNTKGMKKTNRKFVRFCVNNRFDFNAYDQGALNAFYTNEWDKLPREFNWRPFLGINENACILHFHGPKPNDLKRKYEKGKFGNEAYESLFTVDPHAYEYYYTLYCELEHEYGI